jgi:uncharacterized membrane protein
VILAFAWAAWPFTQYSSNSNTNDMIQPALLIWGFYFVTAPFKRGAFAALSAWTKFAPLLLVPLWSGFPDSTSRRPRLRFLSGFAAATIVAFLILFFDPSPWHAIKIFVHHTFGYQLGRASPFSIWDWRQYHARGLPDLHRVQQVLEGALVAGAVVLGRWPRKRSPLRLAAFTGALLVGFEAILTHWSYLYLEWFFPFVAFAFFAPASTEGALTASSEDWSKPLRRLRDKVPARRRELVGLVLAVVVFLGSWEALSHGFYAHPQIIDTPIYQNYGTEMTAGKVPYRDFAVEYPPGALPVFVAPTIDTAAYRTIFSWMMALCGVGCIILVWLRRPSAFALPFLAISPLLLGSLGPNHFDLWPTLFLTAALAAFVRDRHRLGWAALGAAFAIKLFAFVVIPVAIIWTLRRRGRHELTRSAAIGAAVVAAAFGPFAVLAPHGLWESLWGQFSRPLQIETLAGSFFETFGHPVITYSHGSLNLGGYGWLGAVFVVALLGVLAALWTSFARRPVDPDRLVRYSAACVCAFIVFGKVLSPQFLIWLVPLLPLVRGRRGLAATALLGIALVDMLVWFPNRYYPYVTSGHLAWLVFARDLLLLAALAVLAVPESRLLSNIAVMLGLEPSHKPLADEHSAERQQQPQALSENPT